MPVYVAKEEEGKIRFRIPFTVYFIWKDPEYEKYRLVVKEMRNSFEKNSPYSFRII